MNIGIVMKGRSCYSEGSVFRIIIWFVVPKAKVVRSRISIRIRVNIRVKVIL